MKALLILITTSIFPLVVDVNAQNISDSSSSATSRDSIKNLQTTSIHKDRNTDKQSNEDDGSFRTDSTDAAVGMSGLSTTPGVSTTTGAGGLGTNENPGFNTSSDIYTMELRDSIRRAKAKQKAEKNKSNEPSN